MPRVIVEPVALPTDARGWVYEPLSPEQLPAQRNVHMVWTNPGAVRGNHYHRHGTEVAVILGPVLVRWREENEVREARLDPGQACRFTFPPGIPHAMQNIGAEPMLIVAFNTQQHHPEQPDVVREMLIHPSEKA